jgi:hypothetical protein
MEKLQIALRAQDFHESLRVTGVFGPKEVKFKRTLLIGKAASLAMHLRGLLFVEDPTQLEYVAASLGIPALELPTVLRELEVIDFLSVVKSGDEIKRIECRVPEFRSGYQELGERWSQIKPTEAEQAGIAGLDQLYRGPVQLEIFKRSLDISAADFSMMAEQMRVTYANAAKLLARFGANLDHVVEETLYVLDVDAAFATAGKVRKEAYATARPQCASNLIGVSRLAFPEQLIEIVFKAVLRPAWISDPC